MRLLSRTQRHRRRDAHGDFQLVRRSARITSERERSKMKFYTLKSACFQRALTMGERCGDGEARRLGERDAVIF